MVSNFEPWLADILALQEVDHLFATVVISGVLGVAKPDPRIFEAALAGAGAASATVHVGDQPATTWPRPGRRHHPGPDRPLRPLPAPATPTGRDLAGLVQLVRVTAPGNGQRWVDGPELLRVIANDERPPQGEWVAELTRAARLARLADPELRDEFAYRILAAGSTRQYGGEQLRAMAKQMTANLEAGLGEQDTDSVYLRTYSVLILMEIVAFDNASPFLDQADLDGFLEAALGYLLRERDLRSWVPGPGWANAVGHAADLFMMLARSPHLGATELQRILDAIADRLLTPAPAVFVHHEDERLAYAALNVLRRNLVDRAWLVAWLDRFAAAPGQESWRSAYASEASRPPGNVTLPAHLYSSDPHRTRPPTPSEPQTRSW